MPAFVGGAVLGAVLAGAIAAVAAVPNTFQPNTTISSSDVNANFENLDSRLAALEQLSASSRLTALETQGSSHGGRISTLEGVNAGSRLNTLEGLNAGNRLTTREGFNAGNRLNTLENTTVPGVANRVTTLETTTVPGISGRVTTLENADGEILLRSAVSTNTNARTFQTKVVDLNTPSLRYNRDSSNGDNVEILVSGVYAISYCDQSQASGSNGVLAIVRNPVEPLTLDIDSQLANGRVLNLSDVFSGNNVVVVSTTLHLSAGDKVYAYTRNVLPSANNSLFRVVRVR